MRASALCCVFSCLASSALAVHHPLHRHRHDKEKRTEVLVVEEDNTVEEIDVTIYLPGPPPAGYKQHLREKKKHGHEEHLLITYKLPDGSETVVSGPKPTYSGSGKGAGSGKLHVPPSNLSATSTTAGESGSGSGLGSDSASGSSPGSSSLVGGGASSASPQNTDSEDPTSPVVQPTASTSAAADSPAPAATTSASSVAPRNNFPASTAASSAASPSHSGTYLFSALVAFGDNLSDNGNGSYAHNVAWKSPTDVVDGNAIYGAKTWTNGPIAVSYLTDLLGVPMTQNFAFGHAWGGSDFGATIDDTMQQSNFSASLADGPWFHHGEFSEPCWGAPSAKVQINSYIASGVNKDALHFLWIGANDMDAAYDGTLSTSDATLNAAFATNISTKIPALVSTLLDAGAPYVLVANLYPKHLAPLWPNFLGITSPSQWDRPRHRHQQRQHRPRKRPQSPPNPPRLPSNLPRHLHLPLGPIHHQQQQPRHHQPMTIPQHPRQKRLSLLLRRRQPGNSIRAFLSTIRPSTACGC